MAALRARYSTFAQQSCSEHPLTIDALLLFERCQTTPGKPFSGTSGSPV